MKTEGDLQARIERVLPRLMVAFFVLNTLVVVAMVLFRQDITARYLEDIWPVIFPLGALVALGRGLDLRPARRDVRGVRLPPPR